MFGIFSDEGCVEDGFYTREAAEKAISERYSVDDGVHAGECCHDHPDEERESCEECATDADDSDDCQTCHGEGVVWTQTVGFDKPVACPRCTTGVVR